MRYLTKKTYYFSQFFRFLSIFILGFCLSLASSAFFFRSKMFTSFFTPASINILAPEDACEAKSWTWTGNSCIAPKVSTTQKVVLIPTKTVTATPKTSTTISKENICIDEGGEWKTGKCVFEKDTPVTPNPPPINVSENMSNTAQSTNDKCMSACIGNGTPISTCASRCQTSQNVVEFSALERKLMADHCFRTYKEYISSTNSCGDPIKCGNGFRTEADGSCTSIVPGDVRNQIKLADEQRCKDLGLPYNTTTGLCQTHTTPKKIDCTPGISSDRKTKIECINSKGIITVKSSYCKNGFISSGACPVTADLNLSLKKYNNSTCNNSCNPITELCQLVGAGSSFAGYYCRPKPINSMASYPSNPLSAPIDPTFNAKIKSISDYNSYINRRCTIPNEQIFFGIVGEKRCRLYCDQNSLTIKQDSCYPIIPSGITEKFCDKSNKNVIDKSGKTLQICSILGCQNGACVINPSYTKNCTKPGTVVPTGNNTYSYCNQSGILESLGKNKQIIFSDYCPNSFRNEIIEIMSTSPNLISQNTDVPLKIDCAGYQQFGGQTNDPNSITLFCDPIKYFNNITQCPATIIHELSHVWAIQNAPSDGFNVADYNKSTGCTQNEKGVWIYPVEQPVRRVYQNQSCSESWAYANVAYKNDSCKMKEKFPVQYNLIKNSVYDGKESCDKTFEDNNQPKN